MLIQIYKYCVKETISPTIPAWCSIDKSCYVALIGLMHSIVSFFGLFTSELTW